MPTSRCTIRTAVWNYEVGAKSEFMQRRLSINLALYHIDWKDVQQAVADPGCGYLIVANVGEAQSRGVEAEIMMRPIDNLTVSAIASYTDAEFTSIADAYQLASASTAGDPLPGIPRKKFNVDAQYGRDAGRTIAPGSCARTGAGSALCRRDSRRRTVGRPYGAARRERSVPRSGVTSCRSTAATSPTRTEYVDISEGATNSIEGMFWTQISTPPRTIGLNLAIEF